MVICGWYVVDRWLVGGWYVVGIRLVSAWCVVVIMCSAWDGRQKLKHKMYGS